MAIAVRATLQGSEELERALRAMSPARNSRIQRRALLRSALLIQSDAAQNQIERGGKGPPLADRLTSRTGALRRSIAVDQGPLPDAIAVGTSLIYGAVHELGLGRYPERPFLGPAVDATIGDMERILEEEWLREINRA